MPPPPPKKNSNKMFSNRKKNRKAPSAVQLHILISEARVLLTTRVLQIILKRLQRSCVPDPAIAKGTWRSVVATPVARGTIIGVRLAPLPVVACSGGTGDPSFFGMAVSPVSPRVPCCILTTKGSGCEGEMVDRSAGRQKNGLRPIKFSCALCSAHCR